MFLCLFVCSLIAGEGINRFAPNLACLFLETRKRTQEGQNSEKSVLSSIPFEGGSCSSETKHDRRTAPRSKLFVCFEEKITETEIRIPKNCPGFDSR
jgi:hypothetical protein